MPHDAKPQAITEEMRVHEAWYVDAKKQTVDTLPEFIRHLTSDYEHDYGTICHAIAAASIAAAWAVNGTPQGGITGFQAGAIMWEFVTHWSFPHNKCGLRLIDMDQMLFPQFAYKFTERTISRDTMQRLKEEATRKLAQETTIAVPEVIAHWQSIADGTPPFGFRIEE